MNSVTSITLFAVAWLTGISAFYLPRTTGDKYRLALVFAGAYLFSITLIHLLPELFHQSFIASWSNSIPIGVFVLLGFFIQQGLEFFSNGVEHGHIHVHKPGHHHSEFSAWLVMIALFIHAFMEGSMLAYPNLNNAHDHVLLWGILLHKAPEAFALMTVLLCEVKQKWKAMILLTLFASASPAGLICSSVLFSNESYVSLFTNVSALVCGSFLHISTTIVFESSTNHQFHARKMLVAALGAIVAILMELFI